MRRLLTTASLAIVTLLLLAACAGEPTPTPTPFATATPSPAPTPTAPPTPTPDGALRLDASRDATLFEDRDGALAASKDDGNIAGVTNRGDVRRMLIAFDLTQLPPGSVVTSARLELNMGRTSGGPSDVTVHRALTAWGEGSSGAEGVGGAGAPATAGDPTWLHAVFDATLWQAPGGDFAPDASNSTSVGDGGLETWASPALTADVQAWLDAPLSNHGWLLIGDENVNQTAKRFDSRENPDASKPPLLVLTLAPTT
jgi:hypothetical protein